MKKVCKTEAGQMLYEQLCHGAGFGAPDALESPDETEERLVETIREQGNSGVVEACLEVVEDALRAFNLQAKAQIAAARRALKRVAEEQA